MTRRLAALLPLLLLAVLAPPAASAAGTGDVELVPAPRDGQQQSSFRVQSDEDGFTFDLMNLADAPRTVRLYGAGATEGSGGAIATGAVGSAPWMTLAGQQVTLAPKEVRSVGWRWCRTRSPRSSASSASSCWRRRRARSPSGSPRW